MLFIHETVLKKEAVEALRIKKDGVYVDCTLGGGGHSELIAQKLSTSGTLIGLDQDDMALTAAKERLRFAKCKTFLVKANFKNMTDVVSELGFEQVDGILFDLGVSSPQLDEEERGFSYHGEALLDMRMDQTQTFTAKSLINEWSEEKIAKILFHYGEERFSRRIARLIVQEREKKEIETTLELAEIIKKAIPAAARRTGPHPARRCFQAIRIAVNDELHAFEAALAQALKLVKAGGRITVITFHSLEDRICKRFFQTHAKGCICPPHFPICTCNHKPLLRLITRKPMKPAQTEINKNKRSRSAKLRVVERC